jgi:hypothetical protein
MFAFYRKLLLASLLSLLLAGSLATATLAQDEPPQCEALHAVHHRLHESGRATKAAERLHELIHDFGCHHHPDH